MTSYHSAWSIQAVHLFRMQLLGNSATTVADQQEICSFLDLESLESSDLYLGKFYRSTLR